MVEQISNQPFVKLTRIDINKFISDKWKYLEIDEASVCGSFQNINKVETANVKSVAKSVPSRRRRNDSNINSAINESSSSSFAHEEEIRNGICNDDDDYDDDKARNCCNFCNENFSNGNNLFEHLRIHCGEDPHVCNICVKQFTCQLRMKKHMIRRHTSLNFCESMEYGNDEKSPKNNSSAEKVDEDVATLDEDGEEKKKKKFFLFQCDRCQSHFQTKRELEFHLIEVCPPDGCYVCRDCTLECASRYALSAHAIRVHGIRMHETTSTFGGKTSTRTRIKEERPHMCDVCSKSYCHRSALANHMISHTDNKFPCSKCRKEFASKLGLANHERACYFENGIYRCRCCREEYKTKKELSVHVKKVHDSSLVEKSHLCPVCGKGFAHSTTLKTHLVIHSGEKRFACTLCDKTFAYKQYLEHHMHRHDKKKYTCLNCLKEFSYKTSLWLHTKKHCHVKSDVETTVTSREDDIKSEVTDTSHDDASTEPMTSPASSSRGYVSHLSASDATVSLNEFFDDENALNLNEKKFSTDMQLLENLLMQHE